MNKIVDTKGWQPFAIADFFNLKAGKYYAKDDYEKGETPLVSSSDQNNGIMINTNLKPTFISGITIGKVKMSVFYQERPFCASPDVTVLLPKEKMSKNINLFFVTLLLRERYRFNYGNQIRLNDALKLKVKLPAKKDLPDWDFMEKFIDTHTHNYQTAPKPAKNLPTPPLKIQEWHYYELGKLFELEYGNGFELVNLTANKNGVHYVSRTENNNGVAALVDRVIGVEPTKPNITVAVSGSVLATFLQIRPFYSGYHIMILKPKEKINKAALLFIVTLIKREKYRFNYGRQANRSLKTLKIKLPTKNSHPDWNFMSHFIQTLPFSSQIRG